MRLKVVGGCVAGLLICVSSTDAAVAPASVVDAVKKADKAAVRALLQKHADVNAHNFRFDVPTTKAIQEVMVAAGVSTKLEAGTTITSALPEK